jgi:hypothetical protein
VTAAEAEAALRAAGFVEDSTEAAATFERLLQYAANSPEPVSLAWRQLVTLQQWAADTEPQHSRSSALAEDTLQLALLAQQQRSRIVSLILDCRPVPYRAGAWAPPVWQAAAAGQAAQPPLPTAPRFTEALHKNVKEELQRAVSGQANLVNKLVYLAVTQRRLEAVEWPAS